MRLLFRTRSLMLPLDSLLAMHIFQLLFYLEDLGTWPQQLSWIDITTNAMTTRFIQQSKNLIVVKCSTPRRYSIRYSSFDLQIPKYKNFWLCKQCRSVHSISLSQLLHVKGGFQPIPL